MTAKKATVTKLPMQQRRAARRPGTVAVSRIDQLGLSELFRPNSTTRKAAEILLSGESISKAEIMRRTGIVETVVPRTIAALRSAGIEIERKQDPRTKNATYRAIIPIIDQAPEGSFEFFARESTEAVVKLTHMESTINPKRRDNLSGPEVAVTLTLDSPLGAVTGTAPMSPVVTSLTEGLPLSRVILLPGGRQEWLVGKLPNMLLISDIAFV